MAVLSKCIAKVRFEVTAVSLLTHMHSCSLREDFKEANKQQETREVYFGPPAFTRIQRRLHFEQVTQSPQSHKPYSFTHREKESPLITVAPRSSSSDEEDAEEDDDEDDVVLESDRMSTCFEDPEVMGDFIGLLLIAMPSFPDPGDADTVGMNFLSLFNRTDTSTS